MGKERFDASSEGSIDAGQCISRRGFIKTCVTATAALISSPVFAMLARSNERVLSFCHTLTGEQLTVRYWSRGFYREGALRQINNILRDHRSNQVHPMDRGLLDLLFALRRISGGVGQFHVISGYRCAATNELLRMASREVAEHSFHMRGKAIDIRIPGCDLDRLRRAALSLRAGGVGYYPGSDFIHVDVGPVRSW